MNGSDRLRWRKSTFSGANGGGCVEVADHDGMIMVRDTTNHGRRRGRIQGHSRVVAESAL
jgi:Domain of unknown function (DUF397)